MKLGSWLNKATGNLGEERSNGSEVGGASDTVLILSGSRELLVNLNLLFATAEDLNNPTQQAIFVQIETFIKSFDDFGQIASIAKMQQFLSIRRHLERIEEVCRGAKRLDLVVVVVVSKIRIEGIRKRSFT